MGVRPSANYGAEIFREARLGHRIGTAPALSNNPVRHSDRVAAESLTMFSITDIQTHECETQPCHFNVCFGHLIGAIPIVEGVSGG
jgi:hypothetical protein